ncbi:MAG: hypothetical protein H7A33_00155 [Deltaproteobacteria bacterium]|nr:hypothetical protein [Deltaproteobacteria bacterium]
METNKCGQQIGWVSELELGVGVTGTKKNRGGHSITPTEPSLEPYGFDFVSKKGVDTAYYLIGTGVSFGKKVDCEVDSTKNASVSDDDKTAASDDDKAAASDDDKTAASDDDKAAASDDDKAAALMMIKQQLLMMIKTAASDDDKVKVKVKNKLIHRMRFFVTGGLFAKKTLFQIDQGSRTLPGQDDLNWGKHAERSVGGYLRARASLGMFSLGLTEPFADRQLRINDQQWFFGQNSNSAGRFLGAILMIIILVKVSLRMTMRLDASSIQEVNLLFMPQGSRLI